jgi:hypothetical protein
MSGRYNIVADQATTFYFQFQVLDNNIPWNLGGYSAVMTVRPFLGASTTTLICSTTNGRLTLDAGSGRVQVNVDATTMSNIIAGRYVYDIVLTSGDGIVTRILEGKFIVTAAVTT